VRAAIFGLAQQAVNRVHPFSLPVCALRIFFNFFNPIPPQLDGRIPARSSILWFALRDCTECFVVFVGGARCGCRFHWGANSVFVLAYLRYLLLPI
jgi:hypothetical protein